MKAPLTLRVARPTDDLNALLRFYQDGLGLTIISSFFDHDGYDGIMLGLPDHPYHFEFTRSYRHRAGRAPTAEHLLVLYFPDQTDWRQAIENMRKAGFDPVPACNPYCDRHGTTFEDPDAYRLVLQQGEWPPR